MKKKGKEEWGMESELIESFLLWSGSMEEWMDKRSGELQLLRKVGEGKTFLINMDVGKFIVNEYVKAYGSNKWYVNILINDLSLLFISTVNLTG